MVWVRSGPPGSADELLFQAACCTCPVPGLLDGSGPPGHPAEGGCAEFPPCGTTAPFPTRLVPVQPQLSVYQEHRCRFEGVPGAAWVSLHLMAAQAPNKAEREEIQSFPKVTFPARGLRSEVPKVVTLVLPWSELTSGFKSLMKACIVALNGWFAWPHYCLHFLRVAPCFLPFQMPPKCFQLFIRISWLCGSSSLPPWDHRSHQNLVTKPGSSRKEARGQLSFRHQLFGV